MAITMTGEETFYTSIFDDTNESISGWRGCDNEIYFQGDDGLTYQITDSATLYRVDKDNVTRTLVESLSESEFQARLEATSGLPLPMASGPSCVGVLRPSNYLLYSQTSLASDGTNFSLWKVNSSGELECVTAVNYDHGSQINKAMYYIGTCGIANNKTNDDPIVIFYFGSSAGPIVYSRAWRLPSINDLLAANGAYRTSGETNLNNIAIQGAWSEYGGSRIASVIGGSNNRASNSYFWMLPYQGGTRLYFYQGPDDVIASGTDVDSFAYQMSLIHGDQFLAYFDLGEVTYSNSVAWAPDLTRHVDNTLFRTFNNDGELLPFPLYDADGFTVDSSGLGDFGPGATWVKLSSGRYLVTMGCMMQYNVGSQYTGSLHDLVCRWMAFFYDPQTGFHRLVGKGTFVPSTHAEMSNNETLPSVAQLQPSQVIIEYDETRQRLFWDVNLHFTGFAEGEEARNAFGMVDRLIAFDFTGEPCFLTEVDTTNYDFAARYP